MARDQIYLTAAAMSAYGGRFVRALGNALAVADDDNAQRLLTAFYDVVANYGPGSHLYSKVEQENIPRPEVSDSSFGDFQAAGGAQ